MTDIQNMDLFQKIGENERELSLLRDDLKAANARNEELRAELKSVKAERDQLQKNMELFQKIGESERELSLLRDDLKAANTRIEELRAENRTLRAELEEQRNSAIVNTAARSDLDEKLRMSLFQNRQLQDENEFLKNKIDRIEADRSFSVHEDPVASQNEDNPFEYHVPHLRSVLYKEEYFPDNMQFEDYDFGHIVVGDQACLRGNIVLMLEKENYFQFSGGDIYSISIFASRGYKYVSFDKKNDAAIVEYDDVTLDGKKMFKKTISVPLTACLNAKEILRWSEDYRKYRISQEIEQEQAQPRKRGIFKRR